MLSAHAQPIHHRNDLEFVRNLWQLMCHWQYSKKRWINIHIDRPTYVHTSCLHMYSHSQKERQRDRQRDREIQRQIDKETERDRQTDTHTYTCTYIHALKDVHPPKPMMHFAHFSLLPQFYIYLRYFRELDVFLA